MSGTLLVCVDGSVHSKRSLKWAVRRAAARGEGITLLCVIDRVFGSRVYGPHFEPERNGRKVLDDCRALVEHLEPGVAVELVYSEGTVVSEIVRHSRDRAAVVLGTERSCDHPGPGFGTLPLKVAARSWSPVIIVPELGNRRRHGVVVGVDGSILSETAVRYAFAEARELSTELRAITAWEDPSPAGLVPELSDPFLADPTFLINESSLVHDLVDPLSAANPDVRVECSVLHGEPARVLAQESAHAALLVVGSHGRNVLSRAVLGSVSHDVFMNIQSVMMILPLVQAQSDAASGSVPAQRNRKQRVES